MLREVVGEARHGVGHGKQVHHAVPVAVGSVVADIRGHELAQPDSPVNGARHGQRVLAGRADILEQSDQFLVGPVRTLLHTLLNPALAIGRCGAGKLRHIRGNGLGPPG